MTPAARMTKVLGAAAGVVEADQGAAVRAAVFERRDLPVGIAGHHDRHLPDNRRAPIVGIGDLVFKAQRFHTGPSNTRSCSVWTNARSR